MAYPQQPMGQQQSPFMQAYGSQQMQPQMGGQKGQDQGWGKYLWEMLMGGPGSIEQVGGIQELLQQALQSYQNPHEGFEPIRQDIGNYFKNDIMPHIQNQFNSQTGGHFSSGILGSNVARGQMGLADRLSSAQAQYGLQNRQQSTNAINTAKPQYFQQAGSQGLIDPIMRILAAYMGAPVPSGSGGKGGGPVDTNEFKKLGSDIQGYQPFKLPGQ